MKEDTSIGTPSPVGGSRNRRASISFQPNAETPKEQIALVNEAKKKEKEKDVTPSFKPRRFSVMSPVSVLDEGPRFEHLFNDAKHRSEAKVRRSMELETNVPEFKPQLYTDRDSRDKMVERRASVSTPGMVARAIAKTEEGNKRVSNNGRLSLRLTKHQY